ncbi:hypothetical protein ADK51_31755 [Streptomyces sp. WM6368]|nr:hypothetical protein ADK51_31755 [Streptomyces sp. WM6368]
MHRPVGEQRQDRGAHIAAPGPAPRSTAAAAAAEGASAEGRPERAEGGAPPLETLPTIGPAVVVAPSVVMSVVVSVLSV